MTFVRGVTTTFDNVGSPITTASTIVGADAEGTIDVRTDRGSLTFFKVTASTPTAVEIFLFSDAARTKEIYKAPADATGNFDLTTAFVDRTPTYLRADDGTLLESNSVYYRISNNVGATATFDIELTVEATR